MKAHARTADVNPARLITRRGTYEPDSMAIVYEGGNLTSSQLDQRVGSLAAVLRSRGIECGSRVAFLGLNSATFLVALTATARVGAVFVPINFRLAAPEVTEILRVSEATLIICEEGHRALVESIDRSSLTNHLLIDDDPAVPATDAADGRWELLAQALAAAGPAPEAVPQGVDDVAIVMFTSGTTGKPKGVILTAGNVWWNGVNVDMMVDTRRDDVTLAVAPLFHIGGLNAFTLRTLLTGGTVVVRREFDPEQVLRDLVDLKVSTLFAVPAMLSALARVPHFFEADLTGLRAAVVAAAPVPPSLIVEFYDHGIVLQQAWGLTETAPFATCLPADLTRDKAGSAGIPMPFTEVAVVDTLDHVRPLPSGVAGEIVVRGANVTPGYWNNPEATSRAFDADGWFHTGDIGYLDEDGCLFIVDRLKDLIISGGENVYPAEVESALATMPGVLDVAVVGAPHPTWGETVVAVVTVEPGLRITIDQVRDHAAQTLARYKLPTILQLVEIMPRNASGKLDKIAIRQLASEGS